MFKIDFSYFDYDYGTWANSNCSDPKKLYEAIVFKPEDIIKTIKIWYWTKSNVSEYSIPPTQTNPRSKRESGLLEGLIEGSGMEMISTVEDEYPFIMGGEPGDPKVVM